MFTQSAFCQSAINSLGETAVGYSLTAARWAVLGYDAAAAARAWYLQTFFSADAQARYKEIGTIIGMAMVVTVAAGMTARILFEDYLGNLPTAEEYAIEIDDLGDDAEDDLPVLTESLEMASAIDYAPSLSHEDYLDRQVELEGMTLKQLVPIASDLNLITRKVRKEVLIEAILKAEGYEA